MESINQIKATVLAWGADFFGVADLSLAREEILRQGGDLVGNYPRAISLGIALPKAIVDQLPQRAKREVAVNYHYHAYEVINLRLDLLASQVSSLLQREGYQALPIPVAQHSDNERICALFSHKLAAHLAGLGWIGKSCLLVTPEVGPRVRWVTILTDAPLTPTGLPLEERCGDCQACVEICPMQAFTGEPFRPTEAREIRYDAGKCQSYFAEMAAQDAETAVCGLCLYVCPRGRK